MPSLLSRLRARLSTMLVSPSQPEPSPRLNARESVCERNAFAYYIPGSLNRAPDHAAEVAALVAERDTLRAKLDELAPKPRPVVREDRRMAILRAVARVRATYGRGLSAAEVGRSLFTHDSESVFAGTGSETIAENARRLVDEGLLVVTNGKQGGPLDLTDAGRAALAGGERVVA